MDIEWKKLTTLLLFWARNMEMNEKIDNIHYKIAAG